VNYKERYGRFQFRKQLNKKRISKTFETIEEGEAWLNDKERKAGERPVASKNKKPSEKKQALSMFAQKPPTGYFPDYANPPDKVVVYSVQNDTEICVPFKRAIEAYCLATGHTEIAVPTRYQNITATTGEEQRQVSWEPDLPYINDDLHITDHVAIFPNVMRNATTVNPLAGIKNRSTVSMIIGSNRQHVRSLASPKSVLPTMLFATGSMTVENFRLSSAGANAKSGHTLGAVVVERIPGTELFLWRRITWREGCFWDLNRCWGEEGEVTTSSGSIATLVLGDWHAEDTDRGVWGATKEMQKFLKPEVTVLHDLVTFKFGHHQTFIERLKTSNREVQSGFKMAARYLKHMVDWDTKLVVANSNHDKHLDGWLQRYTHKEWPSDALFYHELMVEILTSQNGRDPFWHAMKMCTPAETFDRIHWLRQAESFIPFHHELGNHGHAGANGARGGPGAWDNMSVRQILGHSHIAGAGDNWIQGGTSGPLDESFHQSYSATLHCHVVEYPNGTTSHLPIVEGKWHV
jgi:hypothetical protein